jgi:cysteine-rich repeat protein
MFPAVIFLCRISLRKFFAFSVVLFTFAAISPASAHDGGYAIGGRLLKIDTRREPAKHQFIFSASKELLVFPTHDPAVEGSAILVRWSGSGGGGGGRSELIELDPASWKGLGKPAGAKGYKYLDKSASRGGIKTVIYKPGAKGGSLKIIAKGAGWDQELTGPNDSVWVHFRVEDEWTCAKFGGDIKKNEDGFFLAKKAVAPSECPDSVCGNGIVESGETCDDGNLDDLDTCSNGCTIGGECNGEDFDSTFDAIQEIIFDSGVYGCASAGCHGAAVPSGGLSLKVGESYAELVDVASTIDPGTKRVVPAEPALSVLYDKVHARNMLTTTTFGGSPMPIGLTALSDEHLQALYEWIRGGAPEDSVVAGTAELLATCLPDPDPLTIPEPDPPAPGTGIQFQQTARPLVANAESEICMATYFDFSDLVPVGDQVNCSLGGPNNYTGKCFRWHKLTLAQDPQSHHAILNFYAGSNTPSSSFWGSWTKKLADTEDPDQGATCDPEAIDSARGFHLGCSSKIVKGIGCGALGGGLFGQGVVVSQESYYQQEFADGVFDLSPVAGIMLWNSHAFNTTNTDGTLNQYLNLEFADSADQVSPVSPVFDISNIFYMNVPPFATQEICGNWVAPSGANLFNLSSHTHRHGVRYRIWAPPNAPCSAGPFCSPGSPGQLIYTSTTYADPKQLDFDPPVYFPPGTSTANRTYRLCSLYDNGSTPSSPSVKRDSNPVGSGCGAKPLVCANEGPNKGLACGSSDSFCDSSSGAADGSCDACAVDGGLTTEDEMFVLLGFLFF